MLYQRIIASKPDAESRYWLMGTHPSGCSKSCNLSKYRIKPSSSFCTIVTLVQVFVSVSITLWTSFPARPIFTSTELAPMLTTKTRLKLQDILTAYPKMRLSALTKEFLFRSTLIEIRLYGTGCVKRDPSG